jgi:nitrile hydratase
VSPARFRPGDPVRVRRSDPPGHIRTPSYVRGKPGVIERLCGRFGNPEELAYNRTGSVLPLYRVRFAQRTVWPDYRGGEGDSIDVEIFEHWLEAASEERS